MNLAMKLKLVIFAILFCLFPTVTAVSTATAAQVNSVVEVRVTAPQEPVSAGEAASLTVELEIARRYHINSNRPLQDYLIPTSVEFEPLAGMTFDEAVFPEPEVKKLPVSDTPMSVYERTVTITADMRPSPDFTQDEAVVKGRVRFQACDRNSCLPPVWIPFNVTVPILAAPSSVVNTAIAAADSMTDEEFNDDDIAGSDFDRRGLLLNLIFAFAGGLALNLTPCVYPLIPVTLAWFGGQAEGRKGTLITHAVVYVLGMAITYSVLGVVAAMMGSFFGAVLQNPIVLVAVALVMTILALSMFDVYELRLPSFLTRAAGSSPMSRTGLPGTLLAGLTVGIVAAPCIGPFVLGLLTYVGERGNAFTGFLLFFALALGLGLPLLILGIFSGSIRRLPRSGAWMVWVRKIFGFVLLAMAVYFLRSLFPPLTYALMFGSVLFLGGIYLAWIAPVPNTGRVFAVIRNIIGGLFFAAALYAVVTEVQPALNNNATRFTSGDGQEWNIRWERYSQERLALAVREQMPVFIDFYADWCVPCRELDEKTYSDPEVVMLSRHFVMIKADLTTDDDPAVKALMEKFRIRGVPTLVFLRPDGGEMPSLRGTGFESADVFANKMNRALRAVETPVSRDGK